MNEVAALLEKLGAPKRTKSLTVRMAAGEIATVECTYLLEDVTGKPILSASGDALRIFAENFVLVPRALYAVMPAEFKAAVDNWCGARPLSRAEEDDIDESEGGHR